MSGFKIKPISDISPNSLKQTQTQDKFVYSLSLLSTCIQCQVHNSFLYCRFEETIVELRSFFRGGNIHKLTWRCEKTRYIAQVFPTMFRKKIFSLASSCSSYLLCLSNQLFWWSPVTYNKWRWLWREIQTYYEVAIMYVHIPSTFQTWQVLLHICQWN